MRGWVAGTKETGRAPKIPRIPKNSPWRPDEAAGEGNQPSVSDWVSRDEFGRQTCPLRESQDRNLRMRHASASFSIIEATNSRAELNHGSLRSIGARNEFGYYV